MLTPIFKTTGKIEAAPLHPHLVLIRVASPVNFNLTVLSEHSKTVQADLPSVPLAFL